MLENGEYYKNLPDSNYIDCLSPDYQTSCCECATQGKFSSAWTIMALSTVIGRPITSVYPRIGNKTVLLAADTFNCTFFSRISETRCIGKSAQPLHLLWTSTNKKNYRSGYLIILYH